MTPQSSSTPPAMAVLAYAVGIDIGMESCMMCCLTMDKRPVIKPSSFDNTAQGCSWLLTRLEQLGCQPQEILIGLEATSRYGENLYHSLLKQGYQLCLLHPGQVHAFSQQRGLRAKTDRLDCGTIARVLLSGEARFGYVPSEEVITYRELVRLQHQLTKEVTRYKNEIHALLVVLFPEFSQVFADPSKPTALAVLKVYPSAQAMGSAKPEDVYRLLHELCPRRYGHKTAATLVQLAQASVSSGQAVAARSISLRILCDQLEQTQNHVSFLEEEIDHLLDQDPKIKGVLSIPELGPMTVAVLRAELGDLDRFERLDQVVAYAGMDLQVRQSGKWKGQTKLSKRGSGRLRRMLYLAALRSIRLPTSPFGIYYSRLVDRGMKKGMAVIAVMRKLLIVAAHLILTQEDYIADKVGRAVLS
jgi:transposase